MGRQVDARDDSMAHFYCQFLMENRIDISTVIGEETKNCKRKDFKIYRK